MSTATGKIYIHRQRLFREIERITVSPGSTTRYNLTGAINGSPIGDFTLGTGAPSYVELDDTVLVFTPDEDEGEAEDSLTVEMAGIVGTIPFEIAALIGSWWGDGQGNYYGDGQGNYWNDGRG